MHVSNILYVYNIYINIATTNFLTLTRRYQYNIIYNNTHTDTLSF
jgi:hypothetical protein